MQVELEPFKGISYKNMSIFLGEELKYQKNKLETLFNILEFSRSGEKSILIKDLCTTLSYDNDNLLNFIELSRPSTPIWNEIDFFNTPFREVIAKLEVLNIIPFRLSFGSVIVFDEIGVSLWIEDPEDDEYATTCSVYIKGMYDDLKGL